MAKSLLHHLLLLLVAILGTVLAQEPEVKVNRFKNMPERIYYFDDTTIVLYHDPIQGTIYRSDNEGKDWSEIETLRGRALMLIPHPHDNRLAFVITRDQTHYRTMDRARTWQEFTMPVPPSLSAAPLSFHADKDKYGWILYQGMKCAGFTAGCFDETYYTKDAFGDTPQLLLSQTSKCLFGRNTKLMKDPSPNLIVCVAFDAKTSNGRHAFSSSRLFSSENFFETQSNSIDFGIGRRGRGVVALDIVTKYMVAALQDVNNPDGNVMLHVSVDGSQWHRAHFPHGSPSELHKYAYSIEESTTHSLGIDVLLHSTAIAGTLFVSDTNGTFLVESLRDTDRNEEGYADFENIIGMEGVGIANVVTNVDEVEGRGAQKKLRSRITYDGGSSWTPLQPPSTGLHGKSWNCRVGSPDCTLHLHSVTKPHNSGPAFSSPAPGFVMGVGNVGDHLLQYEERDTFLSTDAGLTWRAVHQNPHMYEFGDQGSIMVIVDDVEFTEHISYSWDSGKTWLSLSLGVTLRAKSLTTSPDSTSQKFILLGQLNRASTGNDGKYAVVFIDFAAMRKRRCTDSDMERWYARTSKGNECIRGHKQRYSRRKPDADCYVGFKFLDPVEHEERCHCTDDDYECDYNYIREGDKCVSVGPEPIPAGACPLDGKGTYKGSSGYRLIPGNRCIRPSAGAKDEKVQKECGAAQPPEGRATHQTFEFPGMLQQYMYFRDSPTILASVTGGQVWQSSNEGFTWMQIHPEDYFVAIYMNNYWDGRAWLVTATKKMYMTTDTGRTWTQMNAPTAPNVFSVNHLSFHPQKSDLLIWIGSSDCDSSQSGGPNCRTEAYYTKDHGRHWTKFESYVRNCAWARDKNIKIEEAQILCESYREKKGDQMGFRGNHLELVRGEDFYKKKQVLFHHVIGFARFSEYLLVSEVADGSKALNLRVSLDDRTFFQGMLPPNMRIDNHAYTILESSTDSVFLHLTMSQTTGAEWGHVLKSNSNGRYYTLSLPFVNQDSRSYVDFQTIIGLGGIAVMNVVANPDEAAVTGRKKLQTRITHNDGGTWKHLTPPPRDSVGQNFSCAGAQCALHIHGHTKRYDARAAYSHPSTVGLMVAVGNVGTELAPYTESDIFLTRDGGFSWEEIHKDAYLFEFGDSGSVLVMANDKGPTDHVIYSLDEGLTWQEYHFIAPNDPKMRVKQIATVPNGTSRKFILFGEIVGQSRAVAVHLDFSSITSRQCILDPDNPLRGDLEFWSPSEEREERCLFGHQTLYHRRIRDRNCYIGEQTKTLEKFVKNCECTASDFECEFNHVRNSAGYCVLVEGATPLPSDETCADGDDFWYERTTYRKISYSSCEGGSRPDRGTPQVCQNIMTDFVSSVKRLIWENDYVLPWLLFLFLPAAFIAVESYGHHRRGGLSNKRRGYLSLATDDDGQVLLFENEEL